MAGRKRGAGLAVGALVVALGLALAAGGDAEGARPLWVAALLALTCALALLGSAILRGR